MPQTATRPSQNYTPKTKPRVKRETVAEYNMRLYGCPLDHTPNAETIAAIEECRAMKAGEIPCKRMTLEELLAELHS
jgi:hypothetical protein